MVGHVIALQSLGGATPHRVERRKGMAEQSMAPAWYSRARRGKAKALLSGVERSKGVARICIVQPRHCAFVPGGAMAK